jgi:hypothetical protein
VEEEMSEEGVQCFFTFNAEHNRMLDELKNRTGKEKGQLIREAVKLALSRDLKPARYQWIKKNHRILRVSLPAADAQKAKRLWKGKLTPLAVSGILEMTNALEVQLTPNEVEKLRKDLGEISRNLQVLGSKLSSSERTTPVTNSGTAKSVRSAIRQLLNELEYFKRGTEADRKAFREAIDPMEIGYLTSLLKALFDEEGFQRWVLLATEFTMGDKKRAIEND